MTHSKLRKAWRWLAILLLPLASALLLAAPAHAAGDTLSLSITNGTTFTYGGTKPLFTAVVTFGTKPTGNYPWSVYVQLDGTGQTFGSVNNPVISSDGMTMTFSGLEPSDIIAVGQHSAVAWFTNPETGIPVYSSPVNFTINKATIALGCSIDMNGATLVGAGQALRIRMAPYSGSGQLPAEWLSGTYTIKLDGTTHVTYPNLTSDGNYVVTVPAGPAQNGYYKLTCTFNGSTSYTLSTFANPRSYIFSAMHALGTVTLYTNPTTLRAGQNLDFYVVFDPAAGLPIPTGQFSIWIGQHYTNAVTIGPEGDNLVHLNPLSSLGGASDIQIFYMGDVNYNEATVHFPLTNPPIPSSAGTGTGSGGTTGGSSGGSPQATTTAQATASATATATSDGGTAPAQANAGSGPQATRLPASDNGSPLLIVLLVVLGLGCLGGGTVAAIYVLRRAKSPPAIGARTYGTFRSPSSMSWNDDTFPFRPGDS